MRKTAWKHHPANKVLSIGGCVSYAFDLKSECEWWPHSSDTHFFWWSTMLCKMHAPHYTTLHDIPSRYITFTSYDMAVFDMTLHDVTFRFEWFELILKFKFMFTCECKLFNIIFQDSGWARVLSGTTYYGLVRGAVRLEDTVEPCINVCKPYSFSESPPNGPNGLSLSAQLSNKLGFDPAASTQLAPTSNWTSFQRPRPPRLSGWSTKASAPAETAFYMDIWRFP